jgi:hypothetical protein
VKVLLGRRDEEVAPVYARTIAQKISDTCDRPVVLALGLKDHTPAAFRTIVAAIEKNADIWA